MTQEEQKRRGEQAKRIMEDKLVQETLDKIEQMTKDLWSEQEDEKVRERLWYTHQGAKTFRELFSAMITNGDYAAKELLKRHK